MTRENRTWIAEHLGVPERVVENMASRLSASDRSLNAPMAVDGDGEWQDLLAADSPTPEDSVMAEHDGSKRTRWLGEAMATLTAREQLIIRERRLAEEAVTLEKLGERLGISKERVRQIEHQALGKLKKALTEAVGDPQAAGLIPAE